ncbi:hypothetical protein EYF80_044781 [Liparis tanakae]|uniref:Uncharacterized protein n=1 Tax=Liparis tanakae TaxID=230148 RepID=A0A4Z2FWX1_9TELE|nr:hypothetical protein EYF80_044781 [Liparis tanakae]
MDDYDDGGGGDGVHVDVAASSSSSSSSSGLKRLGVSLGLKLRPWEGSCGVRSTRSEVSLIDFTDDSFSSATPSPLTETTTRRQPDDDTLKDTASILDWPLPQPCYDAVTSELEDQSEDQEVRSINKEFSDEAAAPGGLFAASRSESQSADFFQELQREVRRTLLSTV